jgi:glyoxylate/hydroxypyruvate reductase A
VLGKQVANMLLADGFQVSAYRRSAANSDNGVQIYSGEEQLTNFLGNCHVVVLIAPLTETTRGIVDSKFLGNMPAGSWLVNVARGELIHDDDLLNAIERNHLVGASLDVFHTEPLPNDHPFWSNDRIRITPHVAALTRLKDATEQICTKIQQLESGQQPSGLVLRDRGY